MKANPVMNSAYSGAYRAKAPTLPAPPTAQGGVLSTLANRMAVGNRGAMAPPRPPESMGVNPVMQRTPGQLTRPGAPQNTIQPVLPPQGPKI